MNDLSSILARLNRQSGAGNSNASQRERHDGGGNKGSGGIGVGSGIGDGGGGAALSRDLAASQACLSFAEEIALETSLCQRLISRFRNEHSFRYRPPARVAQSPWQKPRLVPGIAAKAENGRASSRSQRLAPDHGQRAVGSGLCQDPGKSGPGPSPEGPV